MKTELLETLVAFQQTGSVTEASTSLRITQSSASKRLAQLESIAGTALFKRQGRQVSLTEAGNEMASKAREAIATLKSILEPQTDHSTLIAIGVSESILTSWGAPRLHEALKSIDGLELDIHAHRSPVIVDKLRMGAYDAGICAGSSFGAQGLISDRLKDENMVLIARKNLDTEELISIETSASTWKSISRKVKDQGYKITRHQESYAAAVNMATNGFGVALAPEGIASRMTQGLRRSVIIKPTSFSRPVSLIYRKSLLQNETFEALREHLIKESM